MEVEAKDNYIATQGNIVCKKDHRGFISRPMHARAPRFLMNSLTGVY